MVFYRLKPEFERAAKRLLQLPVPIKLAKVDATEEKELAKRFEVKGYPTIFIFRNGGNKRQSYKGPRDENGIVEYMKSMQKSPSKVVQSRELLRREVQNDIPTIVGFFNPSQDPSLFDLFVDVANDQFDATNHFVHLEDEKLITELKQKLNSIILFVPVWFRSKYEPNQYKLLLVSLLIYLLFFKIISCKHYFFRMTPVLLSKYCNSLATTVPHWSAIETGQRIRCTPENTPWLSSTMM